MIIDSKKIEWVRSNEILQPSLWDDITDALLENLVETKEWIDQQREEWYVVAIVHLSGDMMHSSHVQYMNIIRAKLRKEIGRPFKLLVGVEADSRTEDRKGKKNVQSQEERAYMFSNLRAVDKVYIEFEWVDEQTNDYRPAWIIQYLMPDVLVSHEEHIWSDEDKVRSQVKDKMGGELVVIHIGDEVKYLEEESMREKYNRSTTNTIIQILSMYKDHPKYNTLLT